MYTPPRLAAAIAQTSNRARDALAAPSLSSSPSAPSDAWPGPSTPPVADEPSVADGLSVADALLVALPVAPAARKV